MSLEQSAQFHSSALEKVLEHRFVAELTTCLWLGGWRDFEVLRSEVDAYGYDLVVEAKGVVRHIQLKSMVKRGKNQDVTVNLRLAGKPPGCVIWYEYDPQTLALGPFRWFGTHHGLGFPDPGSTMAKHSKGTAKGDKRPRKRHRLLRKSRFTRVERLAYLVPILFGRSDGDEFELLRDHLLTLTEAEGPDWLGAVRCGRFDAVPRSFAWETSVELAHLISGYDLAKQLGLGDPFAFEERQLELACGSGTWTGGAATLWVTRFLQHRRWRLAPLEPDREMASLLDRLCLQLARELKRICRAAQDRDVNP